ncbi:transposase [Streptomyces venezuelae]|nr:transposase [Streptomyces venezuelae]
MSTLALQQTQAHADAGGDIDWLVQIDSGIVRTHRHAATGRKGGASPMAPGTAIRNDVLASASAMPFLRARALFFATCASMAARSSFKFGMSSPSDHGCRSIRFKRSAPADRLARHGSACEVATVGWFRSRGVGRPGR